MTSTVKSNVFPYVVGIRIMSIHISCDMYLRLGLHMQIRLYYVLPYKAKISAQHGIGFILDRCIVYLGLTMPYLQKKHLLIFNTLNIKKCTLFLEPSIHCNQLILSSTGRRLVLRPVVCHACMGASIRLFL